MTAPEHDPACETWGSIVGPICVSASSLRAEGLSDEDRAELFAHFNIPDMPGRWEGDDS